MTRQTKSPQRQRTANRAIWIEEAAVKCFLERGYETTTISDIMQKANTIAEQNNVAAVSDGAFYSLFDSKQAIITTILKRDAQKLIDFIASFSVEAELQQLDLFGTLESAHEALGFFYQKHIHYVAVLFSVPDLPASFSSIKDYIGDELTQVLTNFFTNKRGFKTESTLDQEDIEIITNNIVIIFEAQHRSAIRVINNQDDQLILKQDKKRWPESLKIIQGYLKEYVKPPESTLQPWQELAMLEFQAAQDRKPGKPSLGTYLYFHYKFQQLTNEGDVSLDSITNLLNQISELGTAIEEKMITSSQN